MVAIVEMEAALAVMGVVLCVAIIALAGVSCLMGYVVFRRFGKNEINMASEIAAQLAENWQRGADTRRDMTRDIESDVQVAAETRIRRQHFRRDAEHPPTRVMDDTPNTLGVFGDSAILPEMRPIPVPEGVDE